jgi:hypothetical protein
MIERVKLGQQYQLGPGSGIGPFAKGMIISLTISFTITLIC